MPGSRSALLNWTYPVTDRTDCVPRTYVVSVRPLTGNDSPSRVTVDGQLGVNLTGLYPSTRYEVSVTAYLNGKGTASAPIQLVTGPQGPSLPRDVRAGVDNAGNWNVTWRSCGAAAGSCVPAASWRVVPQFCDGRGLSGSPELIDVVADPTSTEQPGARLAGGAALLGRGIRFQVEGIGPAGEVGGPSSATACVTSWSPPDASALRLSASQPGDVAVGDTTSTTLSLNLGGDAVAAAGGVGATVAFSLDGPGGTQVRTTSVTGRDSSLTATFTGVRAGATYSASARVSPPGHPDAGVTVTADAVTTRAAWPALSLDAGCAPDGLLTCTLSVRVGGVSTAATGGERFGLTSASELRCGQVAAKLGTGDLDQGSWTITKTGISQLAQFFGSCTVTVGLTETGDNPSPLFFGGVDSPTASTGVELGAARSADLQAGDFTAAWSPQNGSSARVDYTGNQDLGALTKDWTATLYAPGADGPACGTDGSVPNPTYVPAGDCVQPYGDRATGWHVTLSYADATDGDRHTVDVALADGTPPSYQACTPTSFTATWGATKADGVRVTADGGVLDGCRNVTYELFTPGGTSCGTAQDAPPATIANGCGDAASDGWKVAVTWTNPDGTAGRADPPVTGDPPA